MDVIAENRSPQASATRAVDTLLLARFPHFYAVFWALLALVLRTVHCKQLNKR